MKYTYGVVPNLPRRYPPHRRLLGSFVPQGQALVPYTLLSLRISSYT